MSNKGVATHNLLAANYKFGDVTLYGGWTSSKATGVNGAAAGGATSSVDARSWNVALKWQATSTIAVPPPVPPAASSTAPRSACATASDSPHQTGLAPVLCIDWATLRSGLFFWHCRVARAPIDCHSLTSVDGDSPRDLQSGGHADATLPP